ASQARVAQAQPRHPADGRLVAPHQLGRGVLVGGADAKDELTEGRIVGHGCPRSAPRRTTTFYRISCSVRREILMCPPKATSRSAGSPIQEIPMLTRLTKNLSRRSTPRRPRLHVEALEDRALLSASPFLYSALDGQPAGHSMTTALKVGVMPMMETQ